MLLLTEDRFFWDVDRKKTLAEHAKGLERITFHEKLGTVADKVDRVAKLADWLVFDAKAPNGDHKLARQAAELSKADLVTEMVGEFPELQGLMGGYYARAEGLPDAVADAIRDHYKPVGQGDDVPTAPVTVAVSLADKLDTLVGFFLINEKPTGSKDPFALRRAALGILRTLQENGLRVALGKAASVSISEHMLSALIADFGWHEHFGLQDTEDRNFWVDHSSDQPTLYYGDTPVFVSPTILKAYQYPDVDWEDESDRGVLDFFADRLKVQQREAGVRHDLIDAVFALGGEDDLVRLLARVHALQSFVETENGTNLLAGYKRASNILKKEAWHSEHRRPGLDPGSSLSSDESEEAGSRLGGRDDGIEPKPLSYSPEAAEKALMDALDTAQPEAASAIESEDFAAAMTSLASLRAPIDAFFDEVTVNDDDPAKRANRLDLLQRFRDAVHQVADFSKIEG